MTPNAVAILSRGRNNVEVYHRDRGMEAAERAVAVRRTGPVYERGRVTAFSRSVAV